jgi:hypothetical protein
LIDQGIVQLEVHAWEAAAVFEPLMNNAACVVPAETYAGLRAPRAVLASCGTLIVKVPAAVAAAGCTTGPAVAGLLFEPPLEQALKQTAKHTA